MRGGRMVTKKEESMGGERPLILVYSCNKKFAVSVFRGVKEVFE